MPTKNNEPLYHSGFRGEQQIQTVDKITIHLMGKEEMWPFYAAFATYKINVIALLVFLVFLQFEVVFVRKSPDLVNIAFLPLGHSLTSIRTSYNY